MKNWKGVVTKSLICVSGLVTCFAGSIVFWLGWDAKIKED